MKSRLRYYWEAVRTSYWFLPALLGLAAIGLALITVWLDETVGKRVDWIKAWTYRGGPEGARAVLSTIAGSMITVAGVVFSITIVALSLASGQFGSRLLRNFIRDSRNQFVLGTFTATFLYCLLVLRTVRGTDDVRFVPGISVALGIVLAVASLGVLIYYIHHVAISIQATHVVLTVSQELREAIQRLWPDELGEDPEPPPPPVDGHFPAAESVPVLAKDGGYIDAVDDDVLMELAQEHDLVLRLARRPGHFVVAGVPLAWAWPRARIDEEIQEKIGEAFVLAAQRSPFQDVEFAVDQLVEVAVRALSPGINDPFTAMNCIDRLGEALCHLARRSMPSTLRYDSGKRLRIVTSPLDFPGVADAAFHMIRQYGGGSAAVLIRMLETMALIARQARREQDLAALAHHAQLVARVAHRNISEESDLSDIDRRYQALEKVLSERGWTARS